MGRISHNLARDLDERLRQLERGDASSYVLRGIVMDVTQALDEFEQELGLLRQAIGMDTIAEVEVIEPADNMIQSREYYLEALQRMANTDQTTDNTSTN